MRQIRCVSEYFTGRYKQIAYRFHCFAAYGYFNRISYTPYRFTVHLRISERHCTSYLTHFGAKREIVVSILHNILVLSFLFLCHSFQLITLVDVLVSSYGRQTAKGVRGGIRKAFILDESCKVTSVSHLVLKSNNFEKIKYTQKK